MRKFFIVTCVCSVSVGYFLTIFLGSYWQVPITGVLSFRVNDGWCDPLISGFGAHCFSDYQVPLQDLKTGDYWGSNAYPPIALLPFLVARVFSNYLDDRVVLAFYLSTLFIVMLVPAFYVLRKIKIDFSNIVALAILGFAAHPVIISIDRGSSSGFVVPALFWFAVLIKKDSAAAVIPAAFAIAWRPQYVFLLLLFIGIGRMRRFFLCAALTLFSYSLSFLLMPGGLVTSLKNWKIGLSEHGGLDLLFVEGGSRVSTARGVLHVARFVGELHPLLESFGLTYLRNSYGSWFAPGFLLAGLTTFVFIHVDQFKDVYLKTVVVLALSALVFPITFAYYNSFVLVIGALIMLEERSSFDTTKDLSTRRMRSLFNLISQQWWELLVVAATAITLSPIPLQGKDFHVSLVHEYSGLIWTIVVLLGLVKISKNSIWVKGAK